MASAYYPFHCPIKDLTDPEDLKQAATTATQLIDIATDFTPPISFRGSAEAVTTSHIDLLTERFALMCMEGIREFPQSSKLVTALEETAASANGLSGRINAVLDALRTDRKTAFPDAVEVFAKDAMRDAAIAKAIIQRRMKSPPPTAEA